jgi:hypothetical protein
VDGEVNRDRESPETGGGRLACNCDGEDGVVVGGRDRDWVRSRVEGVSEVVDAFVGRAVVAFDDAPAFPVDAEEDDSARSVIVASPFALIAEGEASDAFEVVCGSKAAARESKG